MEISTTGPSLQIAELAKVLKMAEFRFGTSGPKT